jgi:hypothetical protein
MMMTKKDRNVISRWMAECGRRGGRAAAASMTVEQRSARAARGGRAAAVGMTSAARRARARNAALARGRGKAAA